MGFYVVYWGVYCGSQHIRFWVVFFITLWEAVLHKRLAWALFVLLLATLVVSQQNWFLILLFHNISNLPTRPSDHMAVLAHIVSNREHHKLFKVRGWGRLYNVYIKIVCQ